MPDDANFKTPWLQQLAHDRDHPLPEAGKRAVEIAHTALMRAAAVVPACTFALMADPQAG
jgi:hypothetical protein